MNRHVLAARLANLRHTRTLRGRYEAAIDKTEPWSDERRAVEAEFDAEIDRRIDEDDERGGR